MKWLDSSLKQHIKGVNFLLVNFDRKVLIQMRDKGIKKFPGQFAVPGGAIEVGEYPDMAVVREAREETGLKLCPTDFVHLGNFCYVMDKKLRVNSFYVCLVPNPDDVQSLEGEMIWLDMDYAEGLTLARGTNLLMPRVREFLQALQF